MGATVNAENKAKESTRTNAICSMHTPYMKGYERGADAFSRLRRQDNSQAGISE
jgi:hypothetical protein